MTRRAARYARAASRWSRLAARRRVDPGVRVFYGWDELPGPGDPVAGGTSKLQKLADRFPNDPSGFSLLYLGSSALPRDLRPLLAYARHRRIPVVLNQDGVGYPGWAGARTEEVNAPLRRALHAADHVLYQSAFCRRSAELYLGVPRGTWEILPNAVDVERFTPGPAPDGGPVLLLAGDQTQAYRLELGLQVLAALVERAPGARLLVTGRTVVDAEALVAQLGLQGRVELLGRYAQRDAPALYRRAHLLLHTKVNDPCPNVVLEAMACGLPVVHPASGGTVELVGESAGVGVPHDDGFARDTPPTADALATAVLEVLGAREAFAAAARRRAEERFPLAAWLDRHAELFAALNERQPAPARPAR
jgi:glycosyltransferase involved in cell wall biosynthesis